MLDSCVCCSVGADCIEVDFADYCCFGFDLYDELFLLAGDTCQYALPLQGGVHRHNLQNNYLDGRDDRHGHIPLH